jgi:hypothetical protein
MIKKSGATSGAATSCYFVVERRPEVPFINNEQKHILVPRLVVRLIVVERYLLHN